mmetsp:Transcript_16824/g.65747  ORF Transcript_16824/g.65747 Transcript_16824/m.65747 type:complete len:263 (+) Transcript_16824:1038-1826(+)
MARDPSNVGYAGVDVARVVVENEAMGAGRSDEVAAGGVHEALRLAGAAAGVEHEEGVLAVLPRHFALVACRCSRGGHGHVPALAHRHCGIGALEDEHPLHAGDAFYRIVDRLLERNALGGAESLVCSDHELALRVLHSVPHCLRRKAGEHHRMHAAQPCACQHGNCRLRHHRHVDADNVAPLRAIRLQHVCDPAHFLLQLLVGKLPPSAGLVCLPDDCHLVWRLDGVPVYGIPACVGCASNEPLGVGLCETTLVNLGVGFLP